MDPASPLRCVRDDKWLDAVKNRLVNPRWFSRPLPYPYNSSATPSSIGVNSVGNSAVSTRAPVSPRTNFTQR